VLLIDIGGLKNLTLSQEIVGFLGFHWRQNYHNSALCGIIIRSADFIQQALFTQNQGFQLFFQPSLYPAIHLILKTQESLLP